MDIYIHIYIYISIYIYTCICIYIYIYMYTCLCVCVCVCIHAFSYIHKYLCFVCVRRCFGSTCGSVLSLQVRQLSFERSRLNCMFIMYFFYTLCTPVQICNFLFAARSLLLVKSSVVTGRNLGTIECSQNSARWSFSSFNLVASSL